MMFQKASAVIWLLVIARSAAADACQRQRRGDVNVNVNVNEGHDGGYFSFSGSEVRTIQKLIE